MSDMKCPFCNRNLHKGEDSIYSHLDYMTECKARLFDGSKELWQELTRTRKALDAAKERLNNTVLDAEVFATPEYLASRAKETLDEIIALEQKDVK